MKRGIKAIKRLKRREEADLMFDFTEEDKEEMTKIVTHVMAFSLGGMWTILTIGARVELLPFMFVVMGVVFGGTLTTLSFLDSGD